MLFRSMGISSRGENETKDLNRLIAEADEALYTAKSLGRNKVVWFDSGQMTIVRASEPLPGREA